MSLLRTLLDEVKAVVYIVVFPYGCTVWLSNHRLRKNWRFAILACFGVLCIFEFFRSLLVDYVLANPGYFWSAWVIASVIGYCIGMVLYAIFSWHKNKHLESEDILPVKRTTGDSMRV